jgi:glycosyltransferase involved in cell wall biosynthesis
LNITVAVCCFNSGKVIGKTLQVLRQYTNSDLNVIVIDDGSTDSTSEIAENYGVVLIRHQKNMGYGQARQSAVDNCTTEIIAFIDDSCLVAEDWLETLRKCWESAGESTRAIIGKMELSEPKNRIQRFQFRHSPFLPLPVDFSSHQTIFKRVASYLRGKKNIEAGFIGGFSNGNASFRMKSLGQIGGYDTRFKLGAEDENLAVRIIDEFGPKSIFYNPKIRVTHESNLDLKGFLARNYRYGRSSAFRFRLAGGVPTLMPIPALAAILLFVGVVSQVWLFFLLCFLTPLLYFGRIEKLYFWPDSYLIFCGEIAHLFGVITFLLRIAIRENKNE